MGVPNLVCVRGTAHGCTHARRAERSLLRSLALAASAAALALVALPTGASADPRVPPPACPSDLTLQGVERAPGGVILLGAVTTVTPEVGRVRLAVLDWYHRSMVPGLAPGEHPATVEVMLGSGLRLSGRSDVTRLPQVGSRFLVAGTWAWQAHGISVTCGVLANVNTPEGAAWLEQAEMHYVAVAPGAAPGPPQLPLDAPWFILGMAAASAILVAMVLGAVAQARDPAPAV
jgi:hypothetical protein